MIYNKMAPDSKSKIQKKENNKKSKKRRTI